MAAISPSDSARHALYAELERVLGSDHAETLMAYLPEHPADEAATKTDIARLEKATKTEISRLEEAIDRLEKATRSEFARLEEKIDLRFSVTDARLTQIEDRFDRLEDRFDRLDEKLERMQRFYVGTTVWSMTALTAIFTLVQTFLK